jgi:hypothetical protein
MSINFSSEPYFDDFSEDKKFYKILFKPGYAVQARELNQLQSILQHQLATNGKHFFKEGAMVIPGQVSFDNEIFYVRLKEKNAANVFTNSIIDSFVGKTIYGKTKNVVAEVIAVEKAKNGDPATLFVRYVKSGDVDLSTGDQYKTFISEEQLTYDLSATSSDADVSVAISTTEAPHTGKGSIVSIEKGVYFTNGYFVHVDKHTLVLAKYSQTPTARVGLKAIHTLVTSSDDESLLDNAQNTPNYAAPGADRYNIELVLESRELESENDKDFIELLRIESGVVKKEIRSTEYSVLEQTLARRTYDESGDYVVRDFKIDVREHRNNDRGEWAAPKAYILGDVATKDGVIYTCVVSHTSNDWSSEFTTDTTTKWVVDETPFYNRGIYSPEDGGSDDKLAIAVEPGKAYVQGYEIEKISTEYVEIPKARDVSSIDEGLISYSIGSYLLATNFSGGALPLSNELSSPLYIGFSETPSGAVLASAKLVSIEKHSTTHCKLFVREIQVSAGAYIQNAKYIRVVGGTQVAELVDSTGSNNFELFDGTKTSLVIPLPYYAIQSVVESETNYTVRKAYRNVGVSGGVASVATGGGDFASIDDDTNYVVFDSSTGSIINAALTVSGSLLEVSGLSVGQVDIIATIKRSGGLKTKTLETATHEVTTIDAQNKTIVLPNIDGYRLKSVKMSSVGSFGTPPVGGYQYDIDITDRYQFDDGQTDSSYNYSSIVLKGSYAPPSNAIKVEYEYFSHGATGDYFTVNSYSNIDYKSIPYYKNLALRDCIDFRTNTSVFLKRGEEIFADFSYYLPRKSKISIDAAGALIATNGESSLTPVELSEVPLAMTLCNIDLNAYTFDTTDNNVVINKVDNRRYTMRDIGKLEKRIDNLEYYTSLSLLEQETQNLDVVDSNGDSRYKNGFIVDSFTGHGVGDTLSEDYRCSIDMEEGVCRPFFNMRNVNLIEHVSGSNYASVGDLITLPIASHVPFISQPYGSRTENVNPFAVYTFIGTMIANPSGDEWFETDRRPDIINNIDGTFNTIKSIAEEAGVLGTVWNSWQTTWAGKPRVVDTRSVGGIIQDGEVAQSGFNLKYGKGSDSRPAKFQSSNRHGRRYVTLETTATKVNQSRSGVRTTLSTKIDREVVADKVLNTSVIPFIRSRNVLVKTVGLKPNTKYYAFFDGVNVTDIINPSSVVVMEYNPENTKSFDTTTNAGAGVRNEKERHIGSEVSVCLNVGDVIKTSSAPVKSGVVVGKHTTTVNGVKKYYLRVCNIKNGPFVTGDVFTGTISGAIGRFVSQTVPSMLISNQFGELELIFKIPNTNSMRFRTGSREFKLADTKDGNNTTTRASAMYDALGVVETKQATVNAIRNAQLVKASVNQSRTIVQRAERVASDTGWYDPLAQTFLVESKGGAFLTKVDIFFATKDENLPVTIEIREVVNGYPGKTVLPFSRVVKSASDVKLSNVKVKLNGESVPKYDVATTFEFSSPVYVNDGQEYCLVILSDSNKYRVWISQMGDIIPDSNRTISEQPYAGVLFKSQNASTWTADQYQDLKFRLYKAQFDTSVVGNVVFTNDVLGTQLLELNPFHVKQGNTYMRVFQKDHGFKEGDIVRFSGVSGDIGGIAATHFNNRNFVILGSVQLDSYVVSIGDVISSSSDTIDKSGYFGGADVLATRNIKYSVVQPSVQVQNFPETDMICSIRQTAYQSGFMDFGFTPVIANDNNTFFVESVIKGDDSNSIYVKCELVSTNANVSPVIDTHRASLILINNKLDDLTSVNTNNGLFDDMDFYVPDTKNGASTHSAYISRAIKLLNESSMLNVRFAANIPSGSNIEVYHRSILGDANSIINNDWEKMDATTAITRVEVDSTQYIDMSFAKEFDSNNRFNVVQVKIVFKSIEPAVAPSIRDLRILALA